MTQADDNRTIQVVIIPALRRPLEAWLRARNLVLCEIPAEAFGNEDRDDLPTFIVQPL